MKLRDYQQDAVNAAIAHEKINRAKFIGISNWGRQKPDCCRDCQWVHEFGKKRHCVYSQRKNLSKTIANISPLATKRVFLVKAQAQNAHAYTQWYMPLLKA